MTKGLPGRLIFYDCVKQRYAEPWMAKAEWKRRNRQERCGRTGHVPDKGFIRGGFYACALCGADVEIR